MSKLYGAQQQANDFYPVAVPDGTAGNWAIYTRVIETDDREAQYRNLQHALEGLPEFCVAPGTYKVLARRTERGPEVMMSNTQPEHRTNKDFIQRAHGHVLINGLGLGMILRPLASNPQVQSITVIEKEADVIALVQPSYQDLIDSNKLRIVHGDAFKYPAQHATDCVLARSNLIYDWVLHDIWPDVSPMNKAQMVALKNMYAPFARNQVCWSEELVDRMGRIIHNMRAQVKQLRKQHHDQHRIRAALLPAQT